MQKDSTMKHKDFRNNLLSLCSITKTIVVFSTFIASSYLIAQDKYPTPTIFPHSYVTMEHSRCQILFDSCNVTHSDARTVGSLLEKMNYFKYDSVYKPQALFYKSDGIYRISIFFYSEGELEEKTVTALKSVLRALKKIYSDRKYNFDVSLVGKLKDKVVIVSLD